MTYNEKIKLSLDNIENKLEKYNNENTKDHYKCDYIELLSLISSDELYKDNIHNKFYSEHTDTYPTNEDKHSEISDTHEQELTNIFEILLFRQTLYGNNNYPFIITSNSIKLKNNLTKKQKLYLILLSSANLTTFDKKLQYNLADEFEHITYCAIKQWLPKSFSIKKLGSNSNYNCNTRDMLKKLGIDINLPIDYDQINDISIRANKEKGVDLVAWYKFIDNLPNTLIFLIQCACGKDTVHKQYEPLAYHTYFNFSKYQKEPIISLSTPKSALVRENYIKNINDFAMKDILYIDRLRLLEMITDETCISTLQSFILIDKLGKLKVS